MLPGVIACSIDANAITVLAGPSADAAAIADGAKMLADIARISLPVQVVGGVGLPVPRPLSRLRRQATAGALIGLSSVLVAAVAAALTGTGSWIPGLPSHPAANGHRPVSSAGAPKHSSPRHGAKGKDNGRTPD